MIKKGDPIINGFCYLSDGVMICIDLATETPKKYSLESFKSFMKDSGIDETYIILINMNNGIVIPLFKYKLETKTGKTSVRAKDKSLDVLVDTCYKICIELTSLI